MRRNLHTKRAKFAPVKKVMFFVFRYFLASFPPFFIFCIALPSQHRQDASVLFCAWASPPPAHDKLSTKDHGNRLSDLSWLVKRKMSGDSL